MKRLLCIAFLFVTLINYGQAPEFLKYQAVVRSTAGLVLANQNISVKISILRKTASGTVVFSESHSVQSNSTGSINVDIGRGTATAGSFSAIDWSSDSFFVKVEMDTNGDNVYEHSGTSQLLSVPYALYAKKSGDQKWVNATAENDIRTSNSGDVGIGVADPLEKLHVNGSIRGNQSGALRISSGNGYLDIGAKNADYAHFYTDRPYGFYFGGIVTAREQLVGYHESDLHLSTQSSSTFQPVKRVTILNSNGYVGINKTSPQYMLDVNGTINANSILINGQLVGTSGWSATGDDVYSSNAGNIGIGTSTPAEKLHINGSIRGNQSGALRISSGNGYVDIGPKNPDYAHFYTDRPYGFYFGGHVTAREQIIGYHESDLHLSTQSPSTFQPIKRISILNSNGYVGVNKTSPQYQLDVNGTINATSILINGQAISAGTADGWAASGNNIYTSNTGNIGVGTSAPAEKLHINGSVRGNQAGALRISTGNGYVDIGPKNPDYAHFYTDRPYGFYFGGTVTAREQIVGYHEADFHISTQSPYTYQPEKRISILNSNGFVGVATTQPKAPLEVANGDIYLSNATSGVIMKAPNGNCWRMTVNDSGQPVFTSIPCPQ